MSSDKHCSLNIAIVLIAKRHLYDDVHCQVNLVQLNLCPSGFKYAPSDLPSQTDHCTDGPGDSTRDITNGHRNDGAGVPIGARVLVRARVSRLFAIKTNISMVDIL